jgi:hypothetical protein
MRVFIAVAILSLAAPASADVVGHAGLNLRVDNDAHQIRLIAGLDFGAFDISLTVDPMVITDGQLDTDLIATTPISESGWGLLTGWRTTAIGILGGRQYHEKALIGIGAPLPLLGDLAVRMRWNLEATAVIAKHGAGLPTDWISFGQARDFIDLINFGMYVTIECCHGTP